MTVALIRWQPQPAGVYRRAFVEQGFRKGEISPVLLAAFYEDRLAPLHVAVLYAVSVEAVLRQPATADLVARTFDPSYDGWAADEQTEAAQRAARAECHAILERAFMGQFVGVLERLNCTATRGVVDLLFPVWPAPNPSYLPPSTRDEGDGLTEAQAERASEQHFLDTYYDPAPPSAESDDDDFPDEWTNQP